MNGQKLRELDSDTFAAEYSRWRDSWAPENVESSAAAWSVTPQEAALLAQAKVETLADVPEFVGFMLEPMEIIPEALDRLHGMQEAHEVLPAAIEAFEKLDAPWSTESVEATLRALCAQLEIKPRGTFGPIRVAVTGRVAAPGLFETIFVLGKERTIARLSAAADRLPART
jgi:glutamyl-tRNA synthetase